MRNQEIVFNLAGQSFYYDPPEMFRPSGTPTAQIWLATNDDSATTESATTGACSVDSVNTTLSVAATAGDQTITVTSGTGIVRGRRYLITDADGDTEWVECASITGTTVGLGRPLLNGYTVTSSTFQGTRISISVDSTWMASTSHLTDILSGSWRTDLPVEPNEFVGQAGYRLRWAYTVNSVATIGVSFADLVRYQAKNLVSPLDVEQRFPGWIDRLATDEIRDQGVGLCVEAYHAVRMDAVADALLLRKVRNTEILRELTMYRANLISVENEVMRGGSNESALRVAHDAYTQRYNQLLREPKFPTDPAGGGASAPAARQPVWRR